MKVIINYTIKRPWGYETYYTAITDRQEINGFLPKENVTVEEIIDVVNTLLDKRKNELEVEETMSIEATTVDTELINLKNDIKTIVINAIKANNNITETELQDNVAKRLGSKAEKLFPGLLEIYIEEAFIRGYITEKMYDALRAFIAKTPIEQLEALK